MKEYSSKRLGSCTNPSPVDSALFINDDEGVLIDATLSGCRACRASGGEPPSLEKAGPREKIFFNPTDVTAGIVTCGGLCPGLNDVIRGVTMVLWYRYGVRNILGFRYGYEGLVKDCGHEPIELTPKVVEDIHQDGGTMLGSSRGPQDTATIVDNLVEKRVNILFTLGGDGTQRGALDISREVQKRNLPIAVIGIPKTIDNDIYLLDKTFGFETAVASSVGPITSAHMEAKGVKNGIGLVRLMGRESGFVAVYASLASSDVNLVLIPEVSFTIDGIMRYLIERIKAKAHAVIVVAEGAGQELMNATGADKSGNKKLGDIGLFLKGEIVKHFGEQEVPVSVKYIDPSYMIRSAPAIADDSVFCFHLAENAVHAAMSGRTELVIGTRNGQFVHIPTELAIEKRKKVNPRGLLWQSVLDNTGQPMDLS